VPLGLDLLAIPVGICAPSVLFVHTAGEAVAVAVGLLVVMCANAAAVRHQLATQDNVPRCAVLLAYFAGVSVYCGWAAAFCRLWCAATACYVAAFCVSPPVHHGFAAAPWHRRGRNGWHEDFHGLLAVADGLYVVLGC
jgi:hypothetical protein